MQLRAGVTIVPGDTVTSQTLYDLIAGATPASVAAADFDGGLLTVIVGSNATNPETPGAWWYDQTEMLLKGYADQVDETGVSLWLSLGPDRFDEAFLAAEALPPGALCRFAPTGEGRQVLRVTGHGAPDGICVVATNATIPTGTWFAGTIEGFVKAWFPYKPVADTSPGAQGALTGQSVFPVSWDPGGLGRSSVPANTANEFVYGVGAQRVDPVTTVSNGHHLGWILFTGARYTKR